MTQWGLYFNSNPWGIHPSSIGVVALGSHWAKISEAAADKTSYAFSTHPLIYIYQWIILGII